MRSAGRSRGVLHAGLAVVAALVSACAADGDEAVDRAVASGVGVVAEGCGLTAQVGSGVVLRHTGDEAGGVDDTLVVTVAHTIKGAATVTVVDADSDEHRARVVGFDKDADLAVLAVSDLDAPALAAAAASATGLGGTEGSIVTWSREDGVEQAPVEIVKRLRVTIEDIYIDEVVERGAWEIAGPVSVGDSGGPVLDASGDVVGIVYASSRGRDRVGFATDQAELADLLTSVTGATVDNGTCF